MKRRVDQVLDDFGLTRVADTIVGNALLRGVSGGEKRRVTLAAQLITFPPIVLLDEPTSGLDSAAAYNVIMLIKKVWSYYNYSRSLNYAGSLLWRPSISQAQRLTNCLTS
jgi:ABC-type multidrug transport system ATPase subunit